MTLEHFADTELTITDDSGFLALLNADRYNSFIGSDWSFEQLQQRLTEQSKKRNLLIWETGAEGIYRIAALKQPTNERAFREIVGEIEVTNGRLHVTNYEDLSMAAQFKEEKLPAEHNANLIIQLPNGIYKALIRQMDENGNLVERNGKIAFEIVFVVTP